MRRNSALTALSVLGFLLLPGGLSATVFPCTEEGILDAIAMGGGPHTFACAGPTTVVTTAEIGIGNDVILDGEGKLTVDGNDDHTVFRTGAPAFPTRVSAELRALSITRGVGAISVGPGTTLKVVDAVIHENRGGIGVSQTHPLCVCNAVVDVRRSTIDGNIGAGMASGGIATVSDSTISRNTGINSGGVWLYSRGSLTLRNSTISGNTATATDGGGMALLPVGGRYAPTASLHNSTVANNSPSAIIVVGEVTLTNSLIEGGCAGRIVSNGGNLESLGDTCGLTAATDQVNVTPGELNLGPLQDNGGPTETHALLEGSFAIDAAILASCPGTDQRGFSRPEPGGTECDVGAYESLLPEPGRTWMLASGVAVLVALRRRPTRRL